MMLACTLTLLQQGMSTFKRNSILLPEHTPITTNSTPELPALWSAIRQQPRQSHEGCGRWVCTYQGVLLVVAQGARQGDRACSKTRIVKRSREVITNPTKPPLHHQVIDIDGVNRTPKPLIAIVPSAALRQAKGLLSDDTAAAGGNADGFVQLLSSANFSRGWFDSGVATPVGGEQSAATIGGWLVGAKML